MKQPAAGAVLLAWLVSMTAIHGCTNSRTGEPPAATSPASTASFATVAASDLPLGHDVLTATRPAVSFPFPPTTDALVIRLKIITMTNPGLQEIALSVYAENTRVVSRPIEIGIVSPYPRDAAATYVFGLPEAARKILKQPGGVIVITASSVPAGMDLRSDIRIAVEADTATA